MLDYFMTFEESFNRFPGFNYEVQGVYQETWTVASSSTHTWFGSEPHSGA